MTANSLTPRGCGAVLRTCPGTPPSCGAGTQRSPGSSSDLFWALHSAGTRGGVPAHDGGGSVCLHTED